MHSRDIQESIHILQSSQYPCSQATHNRVTDYNSYVDSTTELRISREKLQEVQGSGIADKVFESVGMKDSFVPMPTAAVTWTAAPQSIDATEAMHPIVFASMIQEEE
jgi:hypothetical protein